MGRTIVKSEDDVYVTISDEGMKWMMKALTPGSYLVDYIPWRESEVLPKIVNVISLQ